MDRKQTFLRFKLYFKLNYPKIKRKKEIPKKLNLNRSIDP